MAKRTPKSAGGEGKPKARSRATPARAVRSARASAPPAADTVYQLKITLDDTRPPIWRRLLMRDCSLAALHDLIQIGMGWDDYHLHLFEIGGKRYGSPEQWNEPDPWGEQDVADEGKVKLSQLAHRGVKKFRYVYDMGDDWRHTVQIEKVLPAEAGVHYPRCVDGKRAGPPEDCGGPWGYADLVQALQGPQTPRQEELLEWIGGEFDPEAFDLEEVNAALGGRH